MKGSQNIRFAELFRDTLHTHGFEWALSYYKKRGMQAWEFVFWLRAIQFKA